MVYFRAKLSLDWCTMSLVQDRNCKFVQILKFCELPHQPLNRSLACDSNLWCTLPHQISPGSVHYVMPAGRDTSNLTNYEIFGAPYPPTFTYWRWIWHTIVNMWCALPCHISQWLVHRAVPAGKELPSLTKFWIIFGCSHIHHFTNRGQIWHVRCIMFLTGVYFAHTG